MPVDVLTYPRIERTPDQVFTQETLDRVTSYLTSWRQGAGAIGGLHLHPCWNIKAVLEHRYHGQTTYLINVIMSCAIRLSQRTADPFWHRFAGDMAANILYLQAPQGGFFHTSYEFEPSYDCGKGAAPIHQFMPILALLEYAQWEHAEASIKLMIRPAIDRHWTWFQQGMWKFGTTWQRPLLGSGWCGVTNQDLVVVAALAWYGHVYDDYSRYQQFGQPSLMTFLSERYYHQKLGIFERGDQPNFVERTYYNLVIVRMLQIINRFDTTAKITPVIDNVVAHLPDALFEHSDGLVHLSWGPTTVETGERRVLNWSRLPLSVSAYPGFISLMDEYLLEHDDTTVRNGRDALERTVAAYTFVDGTLPGALTATDPIFSVVPSRELLYYWHFLIERLGQRLTPPQLDATFTVERRCRGTTWRSNHRCWCLESSDERTYLGTKPEGGAVRSGQEIPPHGFDINPLLHPEHIELIRD